MGLGVRAYKRFLQWQCRVYMRRMEKNMETTGIIGIIEGLQITGLLLRSLQKLSCFNEETLFFTAICPDYRSLAAT